MWGPSRRLDVLLDLLVLPNFTGKAVGMDPAQVTDDMYELGLLKQCSWLVKEPDGRRPGQVVTTRCGMVTAEVGGFCHNHGGTGLIKQRTELKKQQSLVRTRRQLEEELLPLATEKVLGILEDPDAKGADIIRIWSTIMDRIGLAATQNVDLNVGVNVTPPLDILRTMLGQVREIDGDVVDGEVVEGEG